MPTTNPTPDAAGIVAATGAGSVTITTSIPCEWAISPSLGEAQALAKRHYLKGNTDLSMRLLAGESLVVFTSAAMAVTFTAE